MSFADALQNELHVLHALIMRETRTRFGKFFMGFLWAFLMPALWVLMFYALFLFTQRPAPYGMSTLTYLSTGVFPYLIFRESRQQATAAIHGNRGLLFYPQVRPIDLLIARGTLEYAIFVPVFVLLLVLAVVIEGPIRFDDPARMLLGVTLAWGLGTAAGTVVCMLAVFYPLLEKLSSTLFRPLLWVSGLFFTANSLPTPVRDAMLWNPVLHAIEITRDGCFTQYTAHYADATYPLKWILGMLFVGLTLERAGRERVDSQ